MSNSPMTLVRSKANSDVSMRASIPHRPNSLGTDVEEAPDIWRIHYSWKQGNGSGGESKVYTTKSSFERGLLQLVLEAEANQMGSREGQRFSLWRKLFRQRTQDPEPVRRIERIVRVEHLERGEWVLYNYGVIAPTVAYSRQESR